ncbi:MAG: adenylyl-sulfate kinase [Polyangiaceae bacterium]|nr:adenylyl-sulfate kinase [Polyangiaceae bacterium]
MLAAAGAVVWLTGLPSSGKTTLAWRVHAALRASGRAACVLDGDEVRRALVPAHGHDPAGRAAFYRSLGGLAALLASQGLVVLVPATASRRAFRDDARHLCGRFVEVHVATPLETCRARDPKGLYARASRGELSALPGMGEAYEAPARPEVRVEGGQDPEALARILAALAA